MILEAQQTTIDGFFHQEGGKKLIFTLFPTYFNFSDFFLTCISYVSDLNKLMGHLQWGTHNHLAGGKISNLPCCR